MGLNKLQTVEIDELLSQFGLSDSEKKVYLALLPAGKMHLSPIARAVNFPVTTTQSVVSRLAQKGLIGISKQKSRQVYEAHDPVVIKKLLERQLEDAKNVIPMLQELMKDDTTGAKIKVYYRTRVTDIFHEALESRSKEIYEIVSAKDFQEVIGEKFHFTKRRVKKEIGLKSLRVESNEIKKYSKHTHRRELREAKFLPREIDFKSSVMFWDNKVAFFSTKSEGIAWTVESKVIFEMMKQIFEVLWSISRKMETLEE